MKLKQRWLNFILHCSGVVSKRESEIFFLGPLKTIGAILEIIVLEIVLSLTSLPFYFFIAPSEIFGNNKKAIQVYHLRAKITFATFAFFLLTGLVQLTGILGGITVSPSTTQATTGIVDGENAIDVLGQYDGTSMVDPQPNYVRGATNDTPNRLGFNGVSGVVADSINHRLFVSDTTNNRVLVYDLNNDNTFIDRVPDHVLGQPDFITTTAATTKAGMNAPRGLAYDGTNNRLFVASGSNRVTIYDVASITDGEDAINVLGQPDFTTSTAATTQSKMNNPRSLAYDDVNHRLFVALLQSQCVQVYDVTTITDGEDAANVLGQPDFTSTTIATTKAGMNSPRAVAYDGTNNRLFVASSSNRVTIYDVTSITNGEDAVNVLGQPDFTTSTAATTKAKMNNPQGVAYDSTNNRLFVAENLNRRVLVYDLATIMDGEDAVNVLGQTDFITSTQATTQAKIYSPFEIAYDGTSRLLVTNGSHRITIYDVSTIDDGEDAVDALGQYDGSSVVDPQPSYTKGSANNAPDRFGFNGVTGAVMDSVHHRFFVSDTSNNRVLVYNLNNDNTFIDRVPDNVLGQPDFVSIAATATQSGMSGPRELAYDSVNDRLFVVENNYNRVMVYDVASITDGENAVNVLGQPDFTTTSGATTQAKMYSPIGLVFDDINHRLFVSQSTANRITVYDVTSITDGENAVNVLGQLNFTNNSATTSQSRMNSPAGMAYESANNRLFVAQSGNHRVMVYDVASITDGENAVNVLGQADFVSGTAASTQSGMNTPQGLAYDTINNRLFVAQSGNHRVMVYDVASITDGENAVNVLGQTDFTSNTSGTAQIKLNGPKGLAYDTTNHRLFVADASNNRISVFDASLVGFYISQSAGSTAVVEGGATDTFDVVLTAQPASDVVFDITSGDTSATIVSSATLTFTNANWNVPQTITVSAPSDADTIAETPVITITVNAASSDNAFDALANKTVTVSVDDTTGPAILNVTSESNNGTYFLGHVISIQVHFAATVNVVGSPTITLALVNNVATANYVSGSGTDTLNFNYTIGVGDRSLDLDYVDVNSLNLNGGTITDVDENNATLTLALPGTIGSIGYNKSLIIDGDLRNMGGSDISSLPSGETNLGKTQSSIKTSDVHLPITKKPPVLSGVAEPITKESPQALSAPLFSDISGHWAQKYIEQLYKKCSTHLYRNTDHFFPDASVTRAEFISLLMECRFGPLSPANYKFFIDVSVNSFASGSIEKALSLGILDSTKKLFHPNTKIIRADAIKMALLTFFNEKEIKETQTSFNCQDIPSSAWHFGYFKFALSHHIVDGYQSFSGRTSKICGAEKKLTRAEAVKIIVTAQSLVAP